ncbi:transposase, partial [Brevibacillus panacihumi]
MAKKNEYSGAEKLAILEELKTGGGTLVEVAHKYNLHKKTLRAWRHQYELYGMEGLEIRIKNNRYSPELKLQAV